MFLLNSLGCHLAAPHPCPFLCPVPDLIWMGDLRLHLPSRSPGPGCSGNPSHPGRPWQCVLPSSPPAPAWPRGAGCESCWAGAMRGVEGAVLPAAARRHQRPANGRHRPGRRGASQRERSAPQPVQAGGAPRPPSGGCHLVLRPECPPASRGARASEFRADVAGLHEVNPKLGSGVRERLGTLGCPASTPAPRPFSAEEASSSLQM